MPPLSSEALGWVYKHSPYRGARLAVHLAVADSVNDMHDYEMYARQAWIAAKARVGRQVVNDALAEMVADGLLMLLEDNAAARKPNRYRLLMPSLAVVFDMSSGTTRGRPDMSSEATPHVVQGDMNMSSEATQNPSKNPREENTGGTLFSEAGFEDFWNVYPHKVGKPSARRAWKRATKRCGDPGTLVERARWYAANTLGYQAKYMKNAAGWLDDDRWATEHRPREDGEYEEPEVHVT